MSDVAVSVFDLRVETTWSVLSGEEAMLADKPGAHLEVRNV